MPVTYNAYTTNDGHYDEGDSTYTQRNNDDAVYTITLTTPFVFNSTNYSILYIFLVNIEFYLQTLNYLI